NGGAESYPFTAQKRSLEEAGRTSPQRAAASTVSTPEERPEPESLSEFKLTPVCSFSLVIGRGGEQINKIQHESGCKVQIAHDSAGLPERSISLTGSLDAIQRARALIDEIVSRGHEPSNGQQGSMQEMIIPAGKAGLIIGKGGETIKQLQERAGVKMILIQDGSQPPNVDKPLRIIGDPYKVQQAKEMVNEILRERDHAGFGDRSEYGSRMGGGGGIEIPVPRQSVGVVIGRNGEMIKKIQSDAGVKIQFKPDDGTAPEKIAHIMGPPDQCQHAVSIINDLLQSIRADPPASQGMSPGGRGWGRGQGSWGPPGGEMTFSIPAHKCGIVIGRGGENIKSISQQTGAFVEVCRQPNGDPNYKLFTIRGSPQEIDHAKQLIEEKIEGPLCPVGGSPGPGGPGGPMGPYIPNPYNAGPPGGAPHGGAPGGAQYCPQGWAGGYQQWQAPNPHDPSECPPNRFSFDVKQQQTRMQHGQPTMHSTMASHRRAPWRPRMQASLLQQHRGTRASRGRPRGGQPDYTKAWEEYYKKMAMAQPGGGAAAAGSTAAAAAGGQQDYSAAWAEYYRQQAAYYGQTGQAPGQGGGPQPGQQVAQQNCFVDVLPLV
uniref:KH-type splicing regulatory protein n=1 Tax=Oryzias sinensis TaxID=183150 RepID=A0A8C7XAX0_9TELE